MLYLGIENYLLKIECIKLYIWYNYDMYKMCIIYINLLLIIIK